MGSYTTTDENDSHVHLLNDLPPCCGSPGRNPYNGTTPCRLSLPFINRCPAILSRNGLKCSALKKWETV